MIHLLNVLKCWKICLKPPGIKDLSEWRKGLLAGSIKCLQNEKRGTWEDVRDEVDSIECDDMISSSLRKKRNVSAEKEEFVDQD